MFLVKAMRELFCPFPREEARFDPYLFYPEWNKNLFCGINHAYREVKTINRRVRQRVVYVCMVVYFL